MATLQKIEKKAAGRHLNRYDLTYHTGTSAEPEKIYEIVSRRPDLSVDTLSMDKAGAALMIFDSNHEHMLLGVEFRMGTGEYVINNIEGFIDPGESPEQAAARELYEETGLSLTHMLDVLPFAYICPSITEMAATLIVCEADGILRPSENPNENITPVWYTREELNVMLHHNAPAFSIRAQMMAYLWSISQRRQPWPIG